MLNSEVDLDKKRLGIGVMNGFIGGFAAIIYGSYRGRIGDHTGGHIGVMNSFIHGFVAIIWGSYWGFIRVIKGITQGVIKRS